MIPADASMIQHAIEQYQNKIDDRVNIEVYWNEDKQLFILDTMETFLMPTSDGRKYWETEVANHEELTWDELINETQRIINVRTNTNSR
jgi:hypothetical protein